MPAATFPSALALLFATVDGPHPARAQVRSATGRAVARSRRGATRREDAERYRAYLERTGLKAYRETRVVFQDGVPDR